MLGLRSSASCFSRTQLVEQGAGRGLSTSTFPPGFAHGADFLYKCTEFYDGPSDRGVRWNDPAIGVKWPLVGEPLLSAKDQVSPMLKDSVLL